MTLVVGRNRFVSFFIIFFIFPVSPKDFIILFTIYINMKHIVTYNIKINAQNEKDHDLLFDTLLVHQEVWNHMSKYVFETGNINKKLIHDENYHECRRLFPSCPSQIIIRAKDSVYATYKSIRSNKKLHKLKVPCTQKNLAIRLDKRIYLFGDKNTIKLTTVEKGNRVVFSYEPYEKFTELFSKYAVCDPLIFHKDNQFWLSVSFEIPAPTHIENSCIGVDLGIRRFAVTSEGLAMSSKSFLKQKRSLRHNKRMLQSKLMKKKSHSARRKLKRLKKKERNKNRNLCHHIANAILDTKSNIIVLEDLSSLKKKNLSKKNFKKSKSSKNRLSQVPFRMIRDILAYKAPIAGKRLVTVDPSFTSQNDHRGIERGTRAGCRYYASDGAVFDADWNASINIARKFSQKKEINKIKHPIAFKPPLDGGLNFMGRVTSNTQSSPVEYSEKDVLERQAS